MKSIDEQFIVFYKENYVQVFRASLAFCGSQEVAQEATQEAFTRAYARWKKVSRMTSPLGWVVITTQNACRKAMRRRPE